MLSEFLYYRGTEMKYTYEVDKDADRYLVLVSCAIQRHIEAVSLCLHHHFLVTPIQIALSILKLLPCHSQHCLL